MKIRFDFKDIDPKVIGEVVQLAMEKIKRLEATNEDFEVEFGSVNLYLSTKDRNTGQALGLRTSDGKDFEWTVRPKPMKRTKKSEYISTNDFTIYE